MKIFFSALLLLAFVQAGFSQDPTYARLRSAKTGCIKMLNGSPRDQAAARRELRSWGQFKLLDNCSGADVAVWVSAKHSQVEGVCGAIVQVLGTSDNSILWSGTKSCSTRTDVAVGQLVRKLRQDVTPGKKPQATAKGPAKGKKPTSSRDHGASKGSALHQNRSL